MAVRFVLLSLILLAVLPRTGRCQPAETEPGLDDLPVVQESDSLWSDTIETDRDSFTPATTIVGKGRLITESAYSFIDNRRVPETHSFPELLFRYGMHKVIELRLGWNYEVGGAANSTSSTDLGDETDAGAIERESNLYYGAKLKATEQRGWRPESALIVEGYTPTSGEVDASRLAMTYVFGWELPDEWKWDTAIRYGTGSEADGDSFRLWAPSTVLKVPVGERWNLHAEYFGVFSQGGARDYTLHYFSPGVHYLLTPDLEIGVRVGWGLNDEAANFFSNVGFGWRI